MKKQSRLFFVSLILTLFCHVARSDDTPIVLFDAQISNASQPMRLLNGGECQRESLGGGAALSIPIGADPYTEKSWDFQVVRPFAADKEPFVLEIEFFDKGAGVIDASVLENDRFHGQWRGADRRASYTRLNTQTVRSAYFQFCAANADLWQKSASPHLKITGLQYWKSLKAHRHFEESDWRRVEGRVPVDVQAMVRLERPMEIVCTAGVEVFSDPNALQSSLNALRELAPLAKVLGFTAVESYVRWNEIESEMGRFDFRFYDAVVEKLKQYGLKWFPLLIVGSAYSLPDWFAQSDENVGFVCLEHGLSNPIQSIWSPFHKKHVSRFVKAFGDRYEPMNVLQGVRLGPTGNYGESQYPAGGNWGYKGQPMHIHIGFWAGDSYAKSDFQAFLQNRYTRIEDLNAKWDKTYKSFDEILPVLPNLCYSRWQRLDMARWYTKSMSDWCEWWALEARKALPHTPIDQSAGGWGFLEAGTDYVDQAKSMAKIHGGIRLTNETDSYQQNFYATRLAATAARLYGINLGYEPASSHTARGAVGRLFNTVATNGNHFFTYYPNLFDQQLAVQKWLQYYPLFDSRQNPIVDVALYYPETMNQLDDGTFRHLYAWGFNPRAAAIRNSVEVDYLNETLLRDGFLDRYKVLVFVWGNIIDADVEKIIDGWARKGGVVIYPSHPRGDLETMDGDNAIFRRWAIGDLGKGQFFRFPGDMEPPSLYGDYVKSILLTLPNLHPLTQWALRCQHPDSVFFSVQEDGHILALNYGDREATIVGENQSYIINPYSILRLRD